MFQHLSTRWRRSVIAIAAAAVTLSASVRAQQPSPALKPQPIGYKDPQLATLLGILVPGGGQLYADRVGKGIVLLGGSAAAIAIAVHGATSTCGVQSSCGSSSATTGGVLAAVLLWGYGWATAARDARLHNEDLLSGGSSFAPFIDGHGSATVAGIRVVVR